MLPSPAAVVPGMATASAVALLVLLYMADTKVGPYVQFSSRVPPLLIPLKTCTLALFLPVSTLASVSEC